MAPQSRPEDPPIEERRPAPLEVLLRQAPQSFEFFQAVRLLGQLLASRQPVGHFANPGREVVRLAANPDFSFPASQIAEVDWPEGGQPLMRVNFMGLNGPMGLLPLYYSAMVKERLRSRDTTLRDFLDIFNHRMLSFFYQAWEKCRFTVAFEKGEKDRLSSQLLDLVGLGTAGLQQRQAVPDEALLFYSGLLATRTRSATALRQLLTDYFDVPVEVEQFLGDWHSLETGDRCRFTESGCYSEQLGSGAVVGDEVWDQQSGVRIRLGPLTLSQYLDFLPDGSAHAPLAALIRFFSGSELDFEVQLVLVKEEVPVCELGAEGEGAPRLGWLTWAVSRPLGDDPDQTVLRM
jgi:type VI secretion system protein ImpH